MLIESQSKYSQVALSLRVCLLIIVNSGEISEIHQNNIRCFLINLSQRVYFRVAVQYFHHIK